MKSNLAHKPEENLTADTQAPESLISFTDLGLPEHIAERVKSLGYEAPTPIQAKSIPILLSGKDLIGQAQTGTGKTAAFALPLLSLLDFQVEDPQILVLTPTRELAIQVAEAFQSYAGHQESFHVLPIYGGQSIGIQLKQLRRRPQVIVGTPGRVMDHLRRESLSLASLKALVMDEADEMLSMGFLEDMEWIITHTPEEKQTALFSATMPQAIRRIAQSYLRNPEEIVVRAQKTDSGRITQALWFVNGSQKLDALTRILEMNDFDGMLIFVRTKTATVELADRLEARGYSAGALNGDMSQEARERTIDRLKQGRLDIVVATDVAARGLDVERISHVINYDIPFDSETYTHRIGRTGRAGRSGTAILFVSDREQGLLRSIERGVGKKLDRYALPTREDIARKKIEDLKSTIETVVREANLDIQLGVIDELTREKEIPEKNIAAALCYLLGVGVTPKREKPERASSEPRESRPSQNRSTRREERPRGRNDRRESQGYSKPKPRHEMSAGAQTMESSEGSASPFRGTEKTTKERGGRYPGGDSKKGKKFSSRFQDRNDRRGGESRAPRNKKSFSKKKY